MLNTLIRNWLWVYLVFYFLVGLSYSAPLQMHLLTYVFEMEPIAAKYVVTFVKVPIWIFAEILTFFVLLISIGAFKAQHSSMVKRGIIIFTSVIGLLYLSLIILFLVYQGRAPSGLLG